VQAQVEAKEYTKGTVEAHTISLFSMISMAEKLTGGRCEGKSHALEGKGGVLHFKKGVNDQRF
jgi:hypothetical protein